MKEKLDILLRDEIGQISDVNTYMLVDEGKGYEIRKAMDWGDFAYYEKRESTPERIVFYKLEEIVKNIDESVKSNKSINTEEVLKRHEEVDRFEVKNYVSSLEGALNYMKANGMLEKHIKPDLITSKMASLFKVMPKETKELLDVMYKTLEQSKYEIQLGENDKYIVPSPLIDKVNQMTTKEVVNPVR